MVDLLGWWFVRGWLWIARLLLIKQNQKILQFFSVGDLLKTLLSPFRQDTISLKGAPFGVKLQAFGMNIISRIFGFGIRSVLIVLGLIITALQTVFGLMAVLAWPLLPLAPVISIVMFAVGVGNA